MRLKKFLKRKKKEDERDIPAYIKAYHTKKRAEKGLPPTKDLTRRHRLQAKKLQIMKMR